MGCKVLALWQLSIVLVEQFVGSLINGWEFAAGCFIALTDGSWAYWAAAG